MPGWKGSTNCEVLEVDEPGNSSTRGAMARSSDSGLKTIVTWTLTPAAGGTLVRMEHSGFKPADEGGFKAMGGGWPRIRAHSNVQRGCFLKPLLRSCIA